MDEQSTKVGAPPAIPRGTFGAYVSGFVLSIALTIAAYLCVTQQLFTHRLVIAAIVVLALAQFIVQLVCFLHVGKSRSKLLILLFMIGVVGIVVGGSLWIMNNLNYRMTPDQINHYLQSQDGL
ncbi:MAG TPA: cytochrome C oxidase subunit IV family protein [Candidatus Saccharimonadales bacterium]|nr:cytochrome C oxidase subunit IV family protein [Candidatus Saccharimonadales bacterium]